jgi:hypothetical protein
MKLSSSYLEHIDSLRLGFAKHQMSSDLLYCYHNVDFLKIVYDYIHRNFQWNRDLKLTFYNIMFVDVDLNPVVIYRLKIDYGNISNLLAVNPCLNYNIGRFRNTYTYTLNCVCPILETSTHIIL